jgi:hypothetical protein
VLGVADDVRVVRGIPTLGIARRHHSLHRMSAISATWTYPTSFSPALCTTLSSVVSQISCTASRASGASLRGARINSSLVCAHRHPLSSQERLRGYHLRYENDSTFEIVKEKGKMANVPGDPKFFLNDY